MIVGVYQPTILNIENNLRIKKPNKDEWINALPWYQNPKVMYFSEGVIDKVYNIDNINKMYTYLSKIGELYFIEIYENGNWISIGDVTLSEENLPIVIGDEKYWGLGIGKKVINALINRARQINLKSINIYIYKYNERSSRLYKSVGFIEVSHNEKERRYILNL